MFSLLLVGIHSAAGRAHIFFSKYLDHLSRHLRRSHGHRDASKTEDQSGAEARGRRRRVEHRRTENDHAAFNAHGRAELPTRALLSHQSKQAAPTRGQGRNGLLRLQSHLFQLRP